ncbi:hypothetical protein V2G26_011079 [Clonostachys chloroleuca]
MPSRRPEKNYSPHKRGRIMQMVELGYTAKEVAEKERVNPRTAYGIASRYRVQKRGQSRDRSGCPTKISEREKRHIMRLIEADPFIRNEDICRQARLSCCTRTLTRWLRSEGIQHVYALRRPKLTTTQAQLRLEFAQGLINKPISWWISVIFTDESTVARGEGEKVKWVFCCRGEKLLPKNYRTRTGASGPNAAYPSLPGDVSIVGNTVLRLQGKRVGTVTYSTDLLFPAQGSTPQVQPVLGRDLLVSALFRLVQFFAYVGDTTRHGLLSNDATTTIFAVLEGLIRIQGATSKQSSSGMMQFTVPLPAWEGPYDFTKEKKEFWRLTELLKVIEAALPSLNIESEEGSRDATVQLFEQIAGWAYIGNYFLRLVKILVEQKRGLYVLSGGLAGTGPLGASVGDEVFVLPGIPTPMVLRKSDNGCGWTVVGATLVHSIMYGQLYNIRNGYEVIDLY